MWEGRHHRVNGKILWNLGEPESVFGEPGGARLPQAPSVATPLDLPGQHRDLPGQHTAFLGLAKQGHLVSAKALSTRHRPLSGQHRALSGRQRAFLGQHTSFSDKQRIFLGQTCLSKVRKGPSQTNSGPLRLLRGPPRTGKSFPRPTDIEGPDEQLICRPTKCLSRSKKALSGKTRA